MSKSRDLTGSDLILTSKTKTGRVMLSVFASILFAGFVVLGVLYLDRQMAADARVKQLEVENQQLVSTVEHLNESLESANESLEHAMLDAEIGAVTQQELERQIGVLNEQLKQAHEKLDFIKNAGKEN